MNTTPNSVNRKSKNKLSQATLISVKTPEIYKLKIKRIYIVVYFSTV